MSAKELLLPAVSTAHPAKCGCDTWGNVSISRPLGVLKIFATTILDLGDFNLYWVPGHAVRIAGGERALELDYAVIARVNEADLRPTGRLVLLHRSNSIFRVGEGESPGECFRVIGCCNMFMWHSGPRLATSVFPTGAIRILQSVPGRLTSASSRRCLRSSKTSEITFKASSVIEPPTNRFQLHRFTSISLGLEGGHGRRREISTRHSSKIGSWDQPASSSPSQLWETSQFWGLFGEL